MTMAQSFQTRQRKFALQKFFILFLISIFSTLTINAQSSSTPQKTRSTLVQVSTYSALEIGMFNGDMTIAQLKQVGDFGIGTFNGMDGELIGLDGKFYQAKVDSTVVLADTTLIIPYAVVHFFQSRHQEFLKKSFKTYDELKAYLTAQFPTDNNPAAFKIAGTFSYIKLRSIPKQSEPYPLLAKVIAQQTIFEFKDIKGTLVGYRIPEYLNSLNWAGYHLHFISEDKIRGGHMLECNLDEGKVDFNEFDCVSFLIPQVPSFQKLDFKKEQK
jgi:acetolactate decarboxylase